jgi:hypothetical protein
LQVERQGISLKVTKSEIRGTRLMAFEMEVRTRELPNAHAAAAATTSGDGAGDDASMLSEAEQWGALLGIDARHFAAVGGEGGGSGSSGDAAADTAEVPRDAQIMVFDVVVSVREKGAAAAAGEGVGANTPRGGEDGSTSSTDNGRKGTGGRIEWVYTPVSVRLKEVHTNTLALSRHDLEGLLAKSGNGTGGRPPVGFDHEDLGLARRAAEN